MLTEDLNQATYQIQSCENGKIAINGMTYTKSLIISPHTLISDWPLQDISMLTDKHLEPLLHCKPTIILLGTGEKSIILPNQKLAILLNNQFHVECMSTKAACRTYTILSSENRNVVAGLVLNHAS